MGIRYQSHVNPAALKSLSYSLEKDSPPVLLPKTASFFINDIKPHSKHHPIKAPRFKAQRPNQSRLHPLGQSHSEIGKSSSNPVNVPQSIELGSSEI